MGGLKHHRPPGISSSLHFHHLGDATGFWRICELNDVMLPDALAEVQVVKIPTVF